MHPNIVLLKLNVYLKVLKVWFRLKITPPHRPVWNLDKVNRKEPRRWAIDSFSPNLALIPAYTHHTIQQLYKYALLGSLSRISIPAIIPNSFFPSSNVLDGFFIRLKSKDPPTTFDLCVSELLDSVWRPRTGQVWGGIEPVEKGGVGTCWFIVKKKTCRNECPFDELKSQRVRFLFW